MKDVILDCEFEISTLADCIQNLNIEPNLQLFFSEEEIQSFVNNNVNLNKSNNIKILTKIDEPSRLSVIFKWNLSFNKNIKEPAIENILETLNNKKIKIKEGDLEITQRTIKINFEIFNVMLEND